jgi:hypothetical protein
MLLANKAAQQLSTLRPSYITFKIKIGMVPPKSSFQITLLALPVVSSAQLASFVQETVMSAILSKVLSRLTDYKSSPLEFSKRWVSPKLGIHRCQRCSHLLTKNPSQLLELDLLHSAALHSWEEWDTITYIYLRRNK